MKAFWSNIALPIAAVVTVLAHSVGIHPVKQQHRSFEFEGVSVSVDTVRVDSAAVVSAGPSTPLKGPADTTDAGAIDTTKAGIDTTKARIYTSKTADDDDFDLFAEDAMDTMPKITARDTMKVPDSLKTIDPFLYKWYVATKDSLTHRIVVDSLKAAGDSTDWVIIDSLYLSDSTAAAIAKFNAWYSSLSKKERRKYDYEQKLPALLRRQDSILSARDSLKAIRDSIVENTPRILESSFVPKEYYYKRLISWKHDREFNRITLEDWDTTFNYRFNDYPFMKRDLGATWLGMAGSAVQTYNYFKRTDDEGGVPFYEPYSSWTYTPQTLPMFNTKTPYTELEYYGTLLSTSSKESDNIRLFTTQNITPSFNFTLEYKRYGGNGILTNEKTVNKATVIAANYLGKRYLAHAGFIHNKVEREENGGVTDNFWIRDTTVDAREVAVNLSGASNTYKKNTLFIDHSYRLPMSTIKDWFRRKDSTYVAPPDSVNNNETTVFIGHSTEYSVYTKCYTDAVSASNKTASAYYHDNYFINPSKSADSLRVARLDNRIFLRFQPWGEHSVVSKIEGGIGDKLLMHYMPAPGSYIRKPSNTNWNSVYTYAGVEGQISRFVDWNALGQYTFAGKERNDFFVKADAGVNIYPFRRRPDSPMTIRAHFSTDLREPTFFEQHFFSNHYKWDNDFLKISTTKVGGSFSVPEWHLSLSADYALLANNIYYDTLGIVRQNTKPMSVLSASLEKNFTFGKIVHLDNKVLFQLSSDPNVLPLPMLALNLRWYVQFNIVREDVMKMQIGLNGFFTTKWNAPAFNPVAGVFHSQNSYVYGAVPIFDVFLNVQWKRACVFIKVENVGQGWPSDKHDYFSAHGYIRTERCVKLGISWPFYVLSGRNRTLSEHAGSGMGGGGGLGGGLGGLKGAVGGMMQR
ncbi:MAG: putative porin [Bacteroidales bacterium]|nr:putative porin [Bacteroidales bacterium]